MDGSDPQGLEASQHPRLLSRDELPESQSPDHEHNPRVPLPTAVSTKKAINGTELVDVTTTGQNEISPGSDLPETDESQSKIRAEVKIPFAEQATGRRRTLRQESRGWKKELAATIVFIAALFLIVGTIYPHRGKPRPNWRFRISVNALLSVYAVLFKAMMAYVVASAISQTKWTWLEVERPLYDLAQYDKASRGLLGSVQWLRSHNVRQPVAALGAMIVIVAIAIDPFLQQIIHYSDCSADMPQTSPQASIPRTNFFNPILYHEGAGHDATPDRNEEIPVISGIFSAADNVNFDCWTGNCTYSTEYSTVGYCSQCEDVSDKLKFTEGCGASGCNLTTTLPSGLSISWMGQPGIFNLLTMSRVGRIGNGSFEIILGQTGLTKGLDPTTGFPIAGCDSPVNNNTWRCRGYGAASCSFIPCVRTYIASVSNGRLSESMISHSDLDLAWGFSGTSTTNLRGYSFILGLVDARCISPEESQSLRTAGVKIDPQVRWIPYIPTFDAQLNISNSVPSDAPFPQSLLAHGCLYMISDTFSYNFDNYFLGQLFYGTVTGGISSSALLTLFDGPQVQQQFYNFSRNGFNAIERIFTNAADALTNHIRQNGEGNYSEPALGVVAHYTTCVQVSWAWIALPAALAGGTVILLIVAIFLSAKEQTPIWKSSPLVFMLHGFDGADWYNDTGSGSIKQRDQYSLNSVSTMEDLAKKITVRLDRSEALIRLRMANTSEEDDQTADKEKRDR